MADQLDHLQSALAGRYGLCPTATDFALRM